MPSGSCGTGPLADLLEHGAALADDHALLALPLDDDLDRDPVALPLRDTRGDRVRQLVAGDGEQLLADELGDPLLLGHVADRVGREHRRPLRSAGDEVVDERVEPVAGARRDREVRLGAELGGRAELASTCSRARPIGLVDDDDGPRQVEAVGDPAVAGAERRRGVEHEAHDVDVVGLAERFERRGVDPARRAPSPACAGRACRRTRAARRGGCSTPRTRWRVVCGLSETIDTLAPQMALTSDDLPTFGPPDQRDEPAAEVVRHAHTLLGAARPRTARRSSRLRILPRAGLGQLVEPR